MQLFLCFAPTGADVTDSLIILFGALSCLQRLLHRCVLIVGKYDEQVFVCWPV